LVSNPWSPNTITLKNPIGGKVVYQGDRNTHLEAELQLNALKENSIEDIPVVREFQDVFPQELLMTHKYRGSQQSSREVKPKFIDSTQGKPKNIYKP
jgi:hypothetical protein